MPLSAASSIHSSEPLIPPCRDCLLYTSYQLFQDRNRIVHFLIFMVIDFRFSVVRQKTRSGQVGIGPVHFQLVFPLQILPCGVQGIVEGFFYACLLYTSLLFVLFSKLSNEMQWDSLQVGGTTVLQVMLTLMLCYALCAIHSGCLLYTSGRKPVNNFL